MRTIHLSPNYFHSALLRGGGWPTAKENDVAESVRDSSWFAQVRSEEMSLVRHSSQVRSARATSSAAAVPTHLCPPRTAIVPQPVCTGGKEGAEDRLRDIPSGDVLGGGDN